jgi:uncharacterized protein (TIGR02145 family)
MKKLTILIVMFLLFTNVFSQTQITLVFTGKDSLTQNAVALDSVNIYNLTENCDTTLYDSVCVLTINTAWPVGFEEPTIRGSESFIVMQNVPNPFQGSTQVRIFLENDGDLNLALYDNQGKNLSEFHNGLKKGWHLFSISTNRSQLLFLKVFDDVNSKTLKILSKGIGNEGNRISYLGQNGQDSKTLKASQRGSGFNFNLGNQLRYTANVNGYHESILFDNPDSSETYIFSMLPSASFKCGDVVNYNGQDYYTVMIGTQCWFKENLNAGAMINVSQNQTNNSVLEKYCYNNLASNCMVYGGLYQWDEMMQYVIIEGAQGICPSGWHIPTDSEWTVLTTFLGGINVAGGKMKEAGTVHWMPPNTGATNSSYFTALPGGFRGPSGYFNSLTFNAYFWSSTQLNATNAWSRSLSYNYEDVYRGSGGPDGKAYGFSVRCIQD